MVKYPNSKWTGPSKIRTLHYYFSNHYFARIQHDKKTQFIYYLEGNFQVANFNQ